MMGWNIDPASWLWMAIWIVALLAMVWLVVRGVAARPPDEDALTILRARYARGEISETEYERARATLQADAPIDKSHGPIRG